MAIKKYGTIKGTIKTIGRLCRCTPFSKQRGIDYPYAISKVRKNQLISYKFDRIQIDVNADVIDFGKNSAGIFSFGGRSWIFYDFAQGKITYRSQDYSAEMVSTANGGVAAVYSWNYSRQRPEIEFWDLDNLKKTNTIVSGLTNMCLSPTGKILAVNSSKQISLWDIEKTAKKKMLYSGSGYSWEKLSFTPYNKYLGIKNNNWLEIWDFKLYKKLRNFLLGPHEVFEF